MVDLFSDVQERIELLRKEIFRHEHLYYTEAQPEISDSEFDRLLNDLRALEKAYPEFVSADSPTQRVGGAATSFNTVTHRVRMMSLENAYSMEDLRDWITRMEKLNPSQIFPIVAELKIDGVSISLQFREGRYQTAATRGDGITGDLVTANVKTIRTLPMSIESPFDMDVRGEVFVPKAVLTRLNQERQAAGEEPFKNCRNLASGTLKSLDPAVAGGRGLRVLTYGIAQARELGFQRHSETLEFLKKQGFPVNHPIQLCKDITDLEGFIREVESRQHQFDFDIDGIVFKVDSLLAQGELDSTSKAPRWAIAYKFTQQQAITRLQSVDWQVGRAQITPVANLEPVELGGTTVSRASLHNLDQIQEKDIRIGDRVIVEKAGFIIPYVVAACHDQRNGSEQVISAPVQCPSCGGPTEISTEISTVVSCPNPACQGVLSRQLIHFIREMEIENVGPSLVDRLIQAEILREIPDLFRLRQEDLLQVERMGTKLAEKILANIQTARQKPLANLISALGIPNVGAKIAKTLASHFGSMDSFIRAEQGSLKEIEGINDKISLTIIEYFQNSTNLAQIAALQREWKGPETLPGEHSSSTLQGKTFVITGEATISRRELEAFIEKHGGRVASSVSPKTSFVLIGSQAGEGYTSSKKTRALQLGIRIIDEHELFRLGQL